MGAPRPLLLVLLILTGLATAAEGGDKGGGDGVGDRLPMMLLIDVYDTTFLVGSRERCAPSCSPEAPEECSKDLNNDDVARFGLGQRPDFGVLRDSACPFPHLSPDAGQAAGALSIVDAVVHTDFSLDLEYNGAGSAALAASDFVRPGEALNFSRAVRVAWIVEPRQLSPASYTRALERVARFDLVFTHVRELTLLDPRIRFCPFGTTYLRRAEHAVHAKTRSLSLVASAKCREPGTSGLRGHCMRHEAIRLLGPQIDGLFAEGYSAAERGWQARPALRKPPDPQRAA